jgi:hypothetical protein
MGLKGRGLEACPPPGNLFLPFLRGFIVKVVKLKIQDFVMHFITFHKTAQSQV